MSQQLTFHDGQAHITASLQDPYPVKDMSERNLRTVVLPQVSVSTTAPTLIAPANPSRKSVKITNTTGTQVVWISDDSQVSSTNGDYLHSTAGSNNVYFGKGQIWGLSATSAQTLAVAEDIYDA